MVSFVCHSRRGALFFFLPPRYFLFCIVPQQRIIDECVCYSEVYFGEGYERTYVRLKLESERCQDVTTTFSASETVNVLLNVARIGRMTGNTGK